MILIYRLNLSTRQSWLTPPRVFPPFEMINGIYQALRPGGRIFLFEYRGEDPRYRSALAQDDRRAGRERDECWSGMDGDFDFLPWQHMMIFTKRG